MTTGRKENYQFLNFPALLKGALIHIWEVGGGVCAKIIIIIKCIQKYQNCCVFTKKKKIQISCGWIFKEKVIKSKQPNSIV